MKYVTPREASESLGVAISTLRRWDKQGKIKSIRTPGGQRRFAIVEYEQDAKPTICYARVSSYSQRDDLSRQVEFLRHAYPSSEIVQEIGSGLNFKRKKLIAILERIYRADVGCLVCAYPDRIVRFGFPLIEWLCDQAGCKLVVLNQRNLSPERELVEDILSILHCFSARLYGLRKYKKQVEKVLQEKSQKLNDETDSECRQENPNISL
ncbi:MULTISPECIES: IS607 family transposase [Planktothricoides]|uniref:IS607 family transposase n=1 Tax=Planktothricoides raciborskii GIHE-MW2 TaxID=2792601 RepID=A0AAU8JKA5_9CYAN|nr:IS607 family transposase [Planktothricoides sp. SR001]KOR33625.1 DNA invertase [Planktothricoides sp. SR001]